MKVIFQHVPPVKYRIKTVLYMYGQYLVKIKNEVSRIKNSAPQKMSSMEDVFNWYSQTALPNPVNFPEQYFVKHEREWKLIRPVGDCEMVILRLID